ncbi:uncharacterized protein BCR38DRAFT_491359 [Pseudomassariella vexata]|uniref:Uncharacterized protein n=1 Tax=Pseudomassariella vexata TaxID=1141098 RepID=A0A1Y2D6J7_9PEZI|nr:uncharacterized protein BCR38DRAFT_491359 [Pseudomassariella vexata]ORY54827.1 hypothetical protein BCR38DRAFT_491359 [Pseudomassariella vexata]
MERAGRNKIIELEKKLSYVKADQKKFDTALDLIRETATRLKLTWANIDAEAEEEMKQRTRKIKAHGQVSQQGMDDMIKDNIARDLWDRAPFRAANYISPIRPKHVYVDNLSIEGPLLVMVWMLHATRSVVARAKKALTQTETMAQLRQYSQTLAHLLDHHAATK